MKRWLHGILADLVVLSLIVVGLRDFPCRAGTRDDSCLKGETKTDEGCIKNPKVRHKTKPVFPKEARRKHLEGHVTLQARVMEDGSVADIEVKDSSNQGHGFEDAAIDALKKWQYEPGTLNGKPTPMYFTVTIDFIYQ